MTFRYWVILLLFLPWLGFAQTMNTTGDWDNAANWAGSNIGDLITENVTLSNSVDPTIRTGFNYIIGDLTTGNNNDLIIQSGASLTLGASGNPKNLTTNNNATLTITGTLTIWGNLVVNNNLIWNVTGNVIIKGNVNLGNNGTITVGGSGTVQIDGNFVGGTNTALAVNGNVSIGGSLTVGNGSIASGGGTVSVGGTCSDGTSPSFCGTGPLPVTLLFFKGLAKESQIVIYWATASELNFDYFELERSQDGKDFSPIAKIKGNGTTQARHDYSFTDEKPLIGTNYYRLKSVDFDGFTEFFKVIVLEYSSEKIFSLSPNPTDGLSLTYNVNFLPPNEAYVIIYDNMGKPIAQFAATDFSHSMQFSQPLNSGVCYAKFLSKDFVKVSRFLVQ
ncbi:MAG: hypothetical protein ACK514_04215 [Bacteroidota bacterium]|jgi:hypothetical protein|nr:hypothetical protein [Cytophagales bacterium]